MYPESAVEDPLDIKGDVHRVTARRRREMGQRVHVLDLRDGKGKSTPSIRSISPRDAEQNLRPWREASPPNSLSEAMSATASGTTGRRGG
jgi:type IV secretory pathway TraG/TraD family ATPase VirD4